MLFIHLRISRSNCRPLLQIELPLDAQWPRLETDCIHREPTATHPHPHLVIHPSCWWILFVYVLHVVCQSMVTIRELFGPNGHLFSVLHGPPVVTLTTTFLRLILIVRMQKYS